MTPGAKCRLAMAMVALSSYACGPTDPPTEEAADPTHGLDQAIPTTTTTTTTPPHVEAPKASRSRPAAAPSRAASAPGTGDTRSVTSTSYCLTSRTADGGHGYPGSVAMNGVPLGSVWQVDGGGTYVVNDRIGHGSQFDIWRPSCAEAVRYGRRTIVVRRVR